MVRFSLSFHKTLLVLTYGLAGMFLYARIVLDNLVELSSIEEIRRELKALPTDLNDA